MIETNCITWVVTTLACFFAELLAEPAGAAVFRAVLGGRDASPLS